MRFLIPLLLASCALTADEWDAKAMACKDSVVMGENGPRKRNSDEVRRDCGEFLDRRNRMRERKAQSQKEIRCNGILFCDRRTARFDIRDCKCIMH